ncbi:MAG TPA: tyrosine-type recombinase/integrase [Gemmataceae bacterium]|nr:tyrosine-type recombinase/integrase [Gemmataceae bacterium]
MLTRRAVLAAGQSTPGTYERYEECLRLHVIPALGKVKLEKLTPQHVDAALTRMEAGVGAYSRTILRAALNKALKWGMVYRNAAALSEPPRPARRKARFLEPDEAERLLEAAEGHKDEALFVCALMLGMREGELLGLQWSDLDLDAGKWRLSRALKWIRVRGQRGEHRLGETETHEEHTIELPQAVVYALRRHRQRQREARLAAKPGRWLESDYVFTSVTGRPQHKSVISGYHLQRLLKKAGLPAVRFHDLRDSCGSLLLSRGIDPKVIQELLGHRISARR